MKNITIIVAAIFAISAIGVGWYIYDTGPKMEITHSANIPNHESGGTLEIGVGSAGTLYCEGKIEDDYILLQWMVDVTFPGNCERGYLFWSEMWFDTPTCPAETCNPSTAIPSPDYVSPDASWINAKGEHHQWGAEIKIYSDDTYFRLIDGNSVYKELWFSDVTGKNVGYDDIKDGRYAIYSYFETKLESCSSIGSIEIETVPFYLVFEGNNFWFEK